MDNAPIDLRRLGADAQTIRLGHYDGLLLPFNMTVEEGQRLQAMDAGAYLLGLRLLLRYLLDIPPLACASATIVLRSGWLWTRCVCPCRNGTSP
ncbi:MAG: hypothetical protein R3E50_00785 [Halioglobus sp.]